MKGKLRGDVIQNSQAGSVVRSGARGRPSVTPSTQNVRANAGFITSTWQTLSASDMAAWKAMAPSYPTTTKFGASRTPSAYNLYAKLNMNLINAGIATLTVPASPITLTDISFTQITVTTYNDLHWQVPVSLASDEVLIVACSRSVSPGRTAPQAGYQVVQVEASPNSSIQYAFFSQYEAAFGYPLVGSQVFVKFVVMNVATGQKGIPLIVPFIVT
jgi:hypothetical protein